MPLTLLGVYCQIHDRPGLSRLPLSWLSMLPVLMRGNEDPEEMLAVCWGLVGRGYGGAAWQLSVLSSHPVRTLVHFCPRCEPNGSFYTLVTLTESSISQR